MAFSAPSSWMVPDGREASLRRLPTCMISLAPMTGPTRLLTFGATSFIQQKLLPMQGDPAQQKMMLYFMPAMFTVFMLFLPSGLGVYMFTNGLLLSESALAKDWYTPEEDAAGASL